MNKEEILKKNNILFDKLKEDKPMLVYNILKSMEEYAEQQIKLYLKAKRYVNDS